MHELSWFNNSIARAGEISTPLMSSATLYGKGNFTTIAIYEDAPFLWDKHWRRLTENAARLGIDLSEYTEEKTRSALADLIEKNRVTNGRARITFFDESGGPIWSSSDAKKTSLLITTADFRPLPKHFRLTFSPYRINTTSPLAGAKSCNYLENLMAFDDAKSQGFDEAIRFNERGEIASAALANVFWLKGGKLYTPGLKTGCLPGTTREFILENLECREIDAGIGELQEANEIFLTSAGIGVVQVAEFEGRPLNGQPHNALKLLPPRS
jgi:branched-chain amino acid aminotransferase